MTAPAGPFIRPAIEAVHQAGARLRYHGDFDARGLAMTTRAVDP